MMKLTYKSVPFELALKINELANIPQLDGNRCFMVRSVTNHRMHSYRQQHHQKHTATSQSYVIKNHKCSFGDQGDAVIPMKLYSDPKNNLNLSDKWLYITFFIEDAETGKKENLGHLELNLTEYVNERGPKEIRYLLKKSKTNSVLKFSLFVIPLQSDNRVNYNVPSRSTSQIYHGLQQSFNEQTTKGLSPTSTTSANSSRTRHGEPAVPLLSTSLSRQGTVNGGFTPPQATPSTPAYMTTTFTDSPKMLGPADKAYSDAILSHIVNKTFKFTWKFHEHKYSEYAPNECIKDIVENNGNGYKKNEDGVNYIDIVHADLLHSRTTNKCQYKEYVYEQDDDDIFEDGQEEEYYENRDNKAVHGREEIDERKEKFMPVNESNFRPNLRSWHLSQAAFKD